MRLEVIPNDSTGPRQQALVMAGSLLAGFVLVSLVFLASGVNPFYALGQIFGSSFGSAYGLGETLTKMIPLLLIGVGLTVPYHGKFWNIGAEGQLLAGALLGTAVGLALPPGFPGLAGIGLMFLAGFIGGALWGMVPAILRIKLGVSEVISTLMLNYITVEIFQFFLFGPLKGKTKFGFPYSDDLQSSLFLPLVGGTRIHWPTLLLGLVAAVLIFLMLRSSKRGYEIRVSGENREAARYAGIDFFSITLLMMVISGGLAGLAGVGEVAGNHHHLSYPQNISAGYGFTAIIVAWLGRLNPLGTILSSFFLAGILVGGDAIQLSLQLPAATVNIVNGLLLICLIAGDFFLHYSLRRKP